MEKNVEWFINTAKKYNVDVEILDHKIHGYVGCPFNFKTKKFDQKSTTPAVPLVSYNNVLFFDDFFDEHRDSYMLLRLNDNGKLFHGTVVCLCIVPKPEKIVLHGVLVNFDAPTKTGGIYPKELYQNELIRYVSNHTGE